MAAYTVNTYAVVGRAGLNQEIGTTSTTQKHKLGERIVARDVSGTRGEGEFIYLKGVANTVVGTAVIFDHVYATAVITARSKGPVAFATAAIVANEFGWYQTKGIAVCANAAGGAAGNPAYATGAGATGTISHTAVAGDIIVGAILVAATDTATNLVQLGVNPSMVDADNA